MGSRSNPNSNPYPISLEISFNNGERVVDTFFRPLYMGSFNAAISDDDGKLLLYTNGCQIYDGNHQYIPESDHLSPGSVDLEYCGQSPGEYPIEEGGLFLPFFNDSIILLLHQRESITGPPLTIYTNALFYTSLRRNGLSYSIVEKTIPILQDSLSEGRLEGIKREKKDSWWVIQGKRNSNQYYTIGLDSAKVDTVFTQTIGDITVKKGEAAAQSVFSPDGKQYARYSPADDLYLFDFDRRSGVLSNYRKIHVADSGLIGGLAFSPNSRFLYACSIQDMYQFDTWGNNVEDSKIHIDHYDGYLNPFPTTFYHMQLGPDCKIYIISPNGNKSMHVINNPNERGIACNFVQHSLILPVSNTITQPNFPVFRVSSYFACDSSITSVVAEISSPPSFVNIYPNPTDDRINILFGEEWSLEYECQVSIFDSFGNCISEAKIEIRNNNSSIDLSVIPFGLYIIRIQSGHNYFIGKVLKI